MLVDPYLQLQTYSNLTMATGEKFNGTLPLSKQPSQASLEYFMHPLEEFGSQKLTAVLAVEIAPGEGSRKVHLYALTVIAYQLTWSIP